MGGPPGSLGHHNPLTCHIRPQQEAGKGRPVQARPGETDRLDSPARPPHSSDKTFPNQLLCHQGPSRPTSLGLSFPICKMQPDAAKWGKGLGFQALPSLRTERLSPGGCWLFMMWMWVVVVFFFFQGKSREAALGPGTAQTTLNQPRRPGYCGNSFLRGDWLGAPANPPAALPHGPVTSQWALANGGSGSRQPMAGDPGIGWANRKAAWRV